MNTNGQLVFSHSKNRIVLFDFLRIISTLLIASAHVCIVLESKIPSEIFLPLFQETLYFSMIVGSSSSTFLFISGFFAYRSILKISSFKNVFGLMKNRFLRLYFPFYLFLIVLWLIFPPMISPLINHLTLTANLISIEKLRAPWLWYISVDFQLHLIFFLILFWLKKYQTKTQVSILVGLVFMGLMLRLFLANYYHLTAVYWSRSYRSDFVDYYNLLHFPPWSKFIPFVMGCLSYVFYQIEFKNWHRKLFGFFALFLMVLLYTKTDFVITDETWMKKPLWIAARDLVYTGGLFFFLLSSKKINFPNFYYLKKFSELSLGIYLFHLVVVILFFRYFNPMNWIAPEKILLLWAISLLLTTPLAWGLDRASRYLVSRFSAR